MKRCIPMLRALLLVLNLCPMGAASLYRIEPDGNVTTVWSAPSCPVYDLLLDDDGTAVLATGRDGAVVRVDDEGRHSTAFKVPSVKAIALAKGDNGRLFIGAGEDGGVHMAGPGLRATGVYLGEPLDAGWIADWGGAIWHGTAPAGSAVRMEVRSGNSSEPDGTWSGWRELGKVERDRRYATRMPATRYLQVRLELRSSGGNLSPEIGGLRLSYLPRNRAPAIDYLRVEPTGQAWRRGPVQSSQRYGMLVADDPVSRKASHSRPVGRGGQISKSFEPGVRTFSWKASDPDKDRLRFRVEIRQEGEQDWFLLADNIADTFYSWDGRGMPDGLYRARLTADDKSDNAGGKQRTKSRTSDMFRLDSSPPQLVVTRVAGETRRTLVSIEVNDPGGEVSVLQYRLEGEEWESLDPVDGVADSEKEKYRLVLPEREPGDDGTLRLLLRAIDSSGNLAADMVAIET